MGDRDKFDPYASAAMPPVPNNFNVKQDLPPGYRTYLGKHQTVYNAYTARLIFDGKRSRKAIQRKTVDYNSSMVQYLQNRTWQRDRRDYITPQPDPYFIIDLLPPIADINNPTTCIPSKFVHSATNKIRCPVNTVKWTPDGRRLITGSTSGEFTIWNGLTFNFETIMQAHDVSVRTMTWSHNDTYLISADHSGVIKYWQTSLNNLKAFQAHKEAVRDLTFSPSDSKFASCSDDGTIKIWNFAQAVEERVLTGHGWDVKCIDWHPHKGLLASGSKDNLVKLWDPKTGQALSTLHGHKNTIVGIEWNQNGNWLVTASRDQLLRIYDIRTMRELQSFRGHQKEVSSVSWHPHIETFFASGGSDGSLFYWDVNSPEHLSSNETAHESHVWSLDWHPVGHVLVSGSNDHTTRFWTRNRPGETLKDQNNVTDTTDSESVVAAGSMYEGQTRLISELSTTELPGLGTADLTNITASSSLTSLSSLSDTPSSGIPGFNQRDSNEPPKKRLRTQEDSYRPTGASSGTASRSYGRAAGGRDGDRRRYDGGRDNRDAGRRDNRDRDHGDRSRDNGRDRDRDRNRDRDRDRRGDRR